MEQYKSEGKHSIYYLVPKTTNIYFLDFKKKRFKLENLSFVDSRTSNSVGFKKQLLLPELATSVQLFDG